MTKIQVEFCGQLEENSPTLANVLHALISQSPEPGPSDTEVAVVETPGGFNREPRSSTLANEIFQTQVKDSAFQPRFQAEGGRNMNYVSVHEDNVLSFRKRRMREVGPLQQSNSSPIYTLYTLFKWDMRRYDTCITALYVWR